MKIVNEPRDLGNGTVEPAHVVEHTCSSCGYDVDEAELAADTCSDCGEPLNLNQSVSIQVTTLPSIFGGTM
jgi:predicted RNA-binding Zn-ribbon protein involved in translation (DUF1610 family)